MMLLTVDEPASCSPEPVGSDFVQSHPLSLMLYAFVEMSNDQQRQVALSWEDNWKLYSVGEVCVSHASTNT